MTELTKNYNLENLTVQFEGDWNTPRDHILNSPAFFSLLEALSGMPNLIRLIWQEYGLTQEMIQTVLSKSFSLNEVNTYSNRARRYKWNYPGDCEVWCVKKNSSEHVNSLWIRNR
jgi:hypothetical protein